MFFVLLDYQKFGEKQSFGYRQDLEIGSSLQSFLFDVLGQASGLVT